MTFTFYFRTLKHAVHTCNFQGRLKQAKTINQFRNSEENWKYANSRKTNFLKKQKTSQAEQGHTRVPSSPSSNWTQSNLLDLLYYNFQVKEV